jgi:hypothetical protein
MFAFIGFALAAASLIFGYTTARRFVRSRLRFVDGIRTWRAPILAGIGAAIVFWPLAVVLPWIPAGTAVLFGLSVGAGVRAGVKDVHGVAGYIEGS